MFCILILLSRRMTEGDGLKGKGFPARVSRKGFPQGFLARVSGRAGGRGCLERGAEELLRLVVDDAQKKVRDLFGRTQAPTRAKSNRAPNRGASAHLSLRRLHLMML